MQIGGGLLLASGKLPRFASAALALTVVPANLGTHSFWNELDPQLKAEKRQQFLTDPSLVGGLLIASADTAGKPSLGWRSRRAGPLGHSIPLRRPVRSIGRRRLHDIGRAWQAGRAHIRRLLFTAMASAEMS